MFGVGLTLPKVSAVLLNVIGRFGRLIAAYKINSKTPDLVADFNGSLNEGTEFYDAGGTVDTFAELITHSRAGNATMTDGYGPELASNVVADWVPFNGGSAVQDGEWIVITGASANSSGVTLPLATEVGKQYAWTMEIELLTATGFDTQLTKTTNSADAFSPNSYVLVNTNRTIIYQGIHTDTTAGSRLTAWPRGVGLTARIRNVSVREVPAIKWAPHNLVTYSEDFSNAAWSKSNVSVTANAAIAPDGALTADKIINTGSSGGKLLYQNGVAQGQSTIGVFAKAGELTRLRINELSANKFSANFDLDAETATLTSGGDGIAARISSIGNGWYLCELDHSATSAANTIVGYPNSAEVTAGNPNYNADGVSGIYIWGAHAFRSDLGGMVDNPDRGDSYVPTAVRPFGPELVTNGDFTSDSDWVKGTGWSIANGKAVASAATGDFSQSGILESGKTYIVELEVSEYVTGEIRVYSGGWVDLDGDSNGRKSAIFTASNTNLTLADYTTFTGSIDNVSVKETENPAVARYLPRRGHHVYNGDAWVNEGLLAESEARTNLLTYSDDFDSLGWSQQAVTLTSNSSVSPDGTQSASLITELATNSYHRLASGDAISPANTISVYLKKHSRRYIGVRYQGTTYQNAEIDLDTQSFGYLGADIISTSVEDVGNDWNRYSITTGGTFGAVGFLTSDVAITSDTIPSFLGVIDQGVYLWGAQAEAGSTPSSYIPTNSATVARAAETLTISAANMPWPEPNYIGSELVTNGTFNTDLSGWTDGSSGTGSASYQAGEALLTSVSSSDRGIIRQQVTVEVGKVYAFSAQITDTTASSNYVRVGGSPGSADRLSFASAGAGTYEGYFASLTSTSVYVEVGGVFGSGTTTIDNISVREIDPLAVSIQMQGRMTYADTGGLDASFVRWYADSANNIRLENWTSSSRTGQIVFNQLAANVLDQATSSLTAYSPGVLVPFNIASRHGSTFINGAVDGTALTANTTPTALPDLSSTDFSLGYDYMGTISMLRVWADDLADVGIAEATEPSEVPSLQLTFDNSETSFTIQDWEQ